MELFTTTTTVDEPDKDMIGHHQPYSIVDHDFATLDHMMGVEEPHHHIHSTSDYKDAFLSTEEGSSIATTVSPESITHPSHSTHNETTYKQTTFATVSTKMIGSGMDTVWAEEVSDEHDDAEHYSIAKTAAA